MKKIIISLGILILTVTAYSENFIFVGNDGNTQVEQQDQNSYDFEMQNLWNKIKKMDAQISHQPDKEKLEKIHDEYVEDFNKYLEYLKKNPELLFKKGDYYFRMARYDKALKVFAADETNIKNLFGAATCARFLNKNMRALEYYNKVIEKDRNFYEAYLGRGIINRNIGNYEGAISDFNNYLSYSQEESVYLGLGDTYAAAGRYREAKNIMEEGRRKYPDSQLIKELLNRIYTKLK